MRYIFAILFILVTVHTSYAASVALRWDNPTTNTDSTPLTDLAGTEVYYRLGYTGTDVIVNAGNTSCYVINDIVEGPYYFRLKAYNTALIKSDFSNQVYKYISSNNYGTCLGNITIDNKNRSNITGGFGGGFQ